MSSPISDTFRPRDFLGFFVGPAAFGMLLLIVVQEAAGATTTWLVIQIARDITEEHVSASGFVGIVVAQTVSYLAGAVSWIFAERAGFGAYGHYMLHFARRNRFRTALLSESATRERVEPFLTSETFDVCFDLVYNLQFYLRLFFQLLFNSLVLGIEIDVGLPISFAFAFVLLGSLQWLLRRPLAAVFLNNQRMTNRMRARTYNAWDNIFSGNRYNFGVWHRDFRWRLREALVAQIRAILAREGWSAVSGVLALLVVLSTTAWVAIQDAGDTAVLIALAATLPRQIEMTLDMHQLTSGLVDLIAVWTRIAGVCEHFDPQPDPAFDERIQFARLILREGDREIACSTVGDAVVHVLASPTGRIVLRGGNGSGKSSLLSALKACLRGKAYYWPTHDRLAFAFNVAASAARAEPGKDGGAGEEEAVDDPAAISAAEEIEEKRGYSSGERQLRVLREIVARTHYPLYLLDEWDANLDSANRATASALVEELSQRARVLEISHRDRV
ncbi:AAA family ATPase [Accumulibacter sp.]|uniref:AAA family ATPase n=1 Tax=Accumulibacter sp. TaxID=2053492 RepID=UPI0025F42586|nr:AAA family ATPase [Accumulibacter sp.]MCM8595216.1 AAA family ATPase [Accumulibacter sp.]MCM8625170.1 AAA family ATPase [Accumulibacter sp.]MDS4049362.1 AAA family ATPase [Accumulibacter sp.]